jgi:hypothetical protein
VWPESKVDVLGRVLTSSPPCARTPPDVVVASAAPGPAPRLSEIEVCCFDRFILTLTSNNSTIQLNSVAVVVEVMRVKE